MYEKLFKDLQDLPQGVISDPTFYEISGFPHYENVISNTLAFFFDSSNNHGLGNLFVESLVQSTESSIRDNLLNQDMDYSCEREVKTDTGHYIDILLHNDSNCIVIENKIYASLYNELKYYMRHAKSNYQSVVGLVLSLHPISKMSNGFTNVTYMKLTKALRENIGFYLGIHQNKYLQLATELIVTIERLVRGDRIMNGAFIEFINGNHEEAERFNSELKMLRDSFRRRVHEVNGLVKNKVTDVYQHPWRDLSKLADVAVSDVEVKSTGDVISLDSRICTRGWRFEVFIRTKYRNDTDIKKYCEDRGMKGQVELDEKSNERFLLHERLPLNSQPKEVADLIVKVIGDIRS